MGWYNNNWLNRKKITVDSSLIDSNLSNFTVLIKLDSSNFDFSKARSDGYDLRFTTDDGETLLKYERESHDDVNEVAYYWVKIPSISSSSDTDIYMYYNNSSASDGQDITNSWDSLYRGVFHLGSNLNDSCAYANHLSHSGSSVNNSGQIEKCRYFNGSAYLNSDVIGADLATTHTRSLWVKSTQTSKQIDAYAGSYNANTSRIQISSSGYVQVVSSSGGWHSVTGSITINDGDWHLITVVFNAGTSISIYVDDTLDISTSFSYTLNGTIGRIAKDAWDASYLTGYIDETSYSNTARNSAWVKATYNSHTDNLLTYGSQESNDQSLDIDETLNFNESWKFFKNPDEILMDETLNINESWDIRDSLEELDISEDIQLNENWDIFVETEQLDIDESVLLSENWVLLTDQELQIDEELNLEDNWNFKIPIDYATKIISYNPLIYISFTSPAKIVHVDISIPSNPTQTYYTLIGNSYAKDIIFNSSNDYFYVICADGKVVKVNKNNLNDQTIIDTGDTDNLLNVDSIDTMFLTFVSTDDEEGELIILDEREVKKLNTDLRWNQEVRNIIQTRLNTILGKIISTDLRFKVNIVKSIKTDLRWLEKSYSTISQYPINYTDFEVYINGVLLSAIDDIDMNSIVITHDITQEEEKASQAQFVLNRYHDKLNYTHAGLFSEITNNNNVIIKIKGRTEFTGKISNLSAVSETETVNVLAIGKRPQYNKRRVNIPLSSVNETLHLYHCLNHNTQINKVILDTYMVITKSDSLYWDGNDWTGYIKDAMTFINYTTAKNYIDSNNELRQYTSQEVYPINRDYSPEIYKGIIANLGTSVEQNVIKLDAILDITNLAKEIEDSKFIPKQNWTYFWLAKFTHLILNLTKGTLQYIGTSLSSLFTDAWKITGCSYKIQKIIDDTEIDLGDYILGEEPYLRINTKNGKKIVKDKWADKDDGLYRERDEGYDYEEYVKRIADLEYQKLHNINGDILPITSSDILISLDAYYYYDIKLLTRINLTNTTSQNSYKNSNGFPVAVKTIRIQCNQEGENTMSVQLTCDNQLSFIELENIDRLYPNDEDYITQEESILNYRKFNPTSWSYVS